MWSSWDEGVSLCTHRGCVSCLGWAGEDFEFLVFSYNIDTHANRDNIYNRSGGAGFCPRVWAFYFCQKSGDESRGIWFRFPSEDLGNQEG